MIGSCSRCLFIFIFCLLANKAASQTQSSVNDRNQLSIDSPKEDLLPISLPQLERMDEVVKLQIESFQQSFIDLLASGEVTDADLLAGYSILGQLYHAYEIFDSAESCYLNAIKLDEKEYSWFHLLGILYEQMGRLSDAIKYISKVREIKPDYIASAVKLGNLYLQLGQMEDADIEFRAGLEMDPGFSPSFFGLGQIAFSERRFDAAVEYFQKALDLVPAANRIHYSLAMSYRGMGEIEKAKEHLTLQGEVGVRSPDPLLEKLDNLIQGERVHLIQGRMAFKAGRYREAVELFTKAVNAKPESARALINLGVSLVQINKQEEAIIQFQNALKYEPENPNAHFNLGVQLYNKNDFDTAIEHFIKVIKLNPKDIETKRQMAKALINTNRIDLALAQLFESMEIEPDNEPTLLLLSNLLINLKRYQDALVYLEAANQRFPDRGLTAHELARLLASCPDTSLRNGPRAVELAMNVFQAQRTIQHGETLSLALAEDGQCQQAAALQKELIHFLEQKNDTISIQYYREDLRRYENGVPCRPPTESKPLNR